MTETIGFQKKYYTDKDFVYVELFENGTSREGVSLEYEKLRDWKGEIPNVPGNKYVIVDATGKATFDSVTQELDNVAYQWVELINQITSQLDETSWCMLPDSGLTETQLLIFAQWRKDIMSITTSYTKIADALNEYTKLMSNKPRYSIKAP